MLQNCPFGLKGWIRKPIFSAHRISLYTLRYAISASLVQKFEIHPSGFVSRHLPRNTICEILCHLSGVCNSSSSCNSSQSSELNPAGFHVLLDTVGECTRFWVDIIFLLPFPSPSSYFICLLFSICFYDYHTLFILHYQIWASITFRWNF